MNHNPRETKQAASRERLAEVIKLGEERGIWRNVTRDLQENETPWRHSTVQAPNGDRFYLSGGSWNKEGFIGIGIASIDGPRGLGVSTRDVLAYKAEAPDAYANHTRSADAILKDFGRRVIDNPEVHDICAKMRERLASMVSSSNTLRDHVATLKAKGFSFRDIETETYRAKGYGPNGSGIRSVEVTNDGTVIFECRIGIQDIDSVMAITKQE